MVIIKRLKFILQEKSYDCGLACLLMVARYYNSNVSRDYLEKVSMASEDGTTMYGLMKTALSLGFEATGKNGSINDIEKSVLPIIAHVKINDAKNLYHYVVITNIVRNKVTIKDPGFGNRVMSKEEFSKIETGNYLFISKTASIKRFIRRKIIREEFNKLFFNNKNSFILIIISTIFVIILELLNLFSLKVILNNALIVKSVYNLSILLFTFAYLLVLKTFLSYLMQLLVLKLSKMLSFNLKSNLIKQLLSLPNLYYQTKERGIMVSLFNDVDIFTESLLLSLSTCVNSIAILVFIYIFFSSLSYLLTITLLISSIFLFLFIYLQKKISKSLISKYYLIKDSYDSKLQQVIINNDKIKGLHLEDLMLKKIKKIISIKENENYNITKYSEIVKASLSFLEGIIYLVILGISGVILISSTSISLPTFLLLESFVFMALKNVENLSLLVLKYQNIRKICERLNDIFNLEKEVLLPFHNYEYATNNMRLVISKLSFKYRDNVVLNNISLTINPKDKVFIYGNSGSGKSTLVKLLGRFLPLEFGHIKLGNIDLTHYNLADLRSIITYVSNKEMLSKGNIKDNIYLSRSPKVNQDVLLQVTGVKKLLREKKYTLKTMLSENGENISMGERSRISLAQALFRPSEIYILDECLSNVDINLEREIIEKLLSYYKDKIVIYISHRLNNKDLFNRVFYLEKGKCYEEL